jgi:hypothetical protein
MGSLIARCFWLLLLFFFWSSQAHFNHTFSIISSMASLPPEKKRSFKFFPQVSHPHSDDFFVGTETTPFSRHLAEMVGYVGTVQQLLGWKPTLASQME